MQYQFLESEQHPYGVLVEMPIVEKPYRLENYGTKLFGEGLKLTDDEYNSWCDKYNEWLSKHIPCSKEFADTHEFGWVGTEKDFEVREGYVTNVRQDSIVPCDAPFDSSNAMEQIEKLAWKLLKENPNFRYGQVVFNAAYELFPKEADMLRATPLDCYYRGQNVSIFLETIHKLLLNSERLDGGVLCRIASDATEDHSSNTD